MYSQWQCIIQCIIQWHDIFPTKPIFYKWSCFFYCTELLIFYGHHLLLYVTLVWTFNTRGVYNFITKEASIPLKLVQFFNEVSLLFYRFLKSGETNELKSLFLWESKKVKSYLFLTGQIFAANKTLFWSVYVWRTATSIFFWRAICDLGRHFNQIHFI